MALPPIAIAGIVLVVIVIVNKYGFLFCYFNYLIFF